MKKLNVDLIKIWERVCSDASFQKKYVMSLSGNSGVTEAIAITKDYDLVLLRISLNFRGISQNVSEEERHRLSKLFIKHYNLINEKVVIESKTLLQTMFPDLVSEEK